jgi:RimJ/RimL family protein N-acetyltransferase
MISGERIVLRAWEKADIDAFMRWFNDPEVTTYLGNSHPCLSREQEERFFDEEISNRYRYCIVTRDEGVLIGNCALMDIDHKNRSAEVGIVIGEKDYWNRGYGREALGLVLDIAFEGLGLNRVRLRHVDFNARGHRCYLAAGFVEEGRLRQANFVGGEFHDDIIMAVLAEDYFARKKAGAKAPGGPDGFCLAASRV